MDLQDLFGVSTPSSVSSLLGADPEQLKKTAGINGLLNMAVGYLAQPKNQRYGSALPYLAKAWMQGQQGAQGTYDTAIQDYTTQQKLNQMKSADDTLKQLLAMPEVANNPSYQMLARTNPAKLIEILNPQRTTTTIDNQLIEYDPASRTAKSLFGTPKIETEKIDRGDYIDLVNKVTGSTITSWKKGQEPKTYELYEAKPTVDANGKTVYLPTVYGAKNKLPVLDMQGQPVTDYAPVVKGGKPTEFENKAALYFKSMTTATKTLDALENIKQDQEGKPIVNKAVLVSGYEQFNPSETLTHKRRSPERKSYVQAQKQWIDSINRVRSGANLPEIEYNRAVATFFPIYGDSDAEVAQKSLARKQEEEAMSVAGRSALKGSQQREEGVDY